MNSTLITEQLQLIIVCIFENRFSVDFLRTVVADSQELDHVIVLQFRHQHSLFFEFFAVNNILEIPLQLFCCYLLWIWSVILAGKKHTLFYNTIVPLNIQKKNCEKYLLSV